jgi:hypothetical protein
MKNHMMSKMMELVYGSSSWATETIFPKCPSGILQSHVESFFCQQLVQEHSDLGEFDINRQ